MEEKGSTKINWDTLIKRHFKKSFNNDRQRWEHTYSISTPLFKQRLMTLSLMTWHHLSRQSNAMKQKACQKSKQR